MKAIFALIAAAYASIYLNVNNTWVRDFAVDDGGNIYISGATSSSIPGYSLLGYHDHYFAKVAPNGTLQFQWLQGVIYG